jgi:hypothetical protein
LAGGNHDLQINSMDYEYGNVTIMKNKQRGSRGHERGRGRGWRGSGRSRDAKFYGKPYNFSKEPPTSPHLDEEDSNLTCEEPVRYFKAYRSFKEFAQGMGEVRLSKRTDDILLRTEYWINTMYKRKADKIRPLNSGSGKAPGGIMDWKKVIYEQLMAEKKRFPPKEPAFLPYSDHIIPKVSIMARGARLTPERIERLVVRDRIRLEEKKFLLEILFAREAMLS